MNQFMSQQVASIVDLAVVNADFRAEDSFLLMDALEKDADEIRERRPRICLEIG